jgi:cell shape-determining protein MreC
MALKRNRNSLGTALAVAAAAFLLVLVILFRQGTASLLWSAVAPLVGMRNAFSNSQVSQLNAQLASTTAALADRDMLAAENAQLRAELGRAGGKQELLAGVLQSPPGTPYDTLIIDAGSVLGVAAGAQVSVGGVAIGQVDAVYTSTARVTLYSAPGQSYQALLTTPGGVIPITVQGQGAGSMQAQVPADTAAAVGDNIVFPGVAGDLAAKVSGISAPAGESFKTLYLHLPVNPFELQFVYIEK